MTGQDIINKFETYVDDGTELSSQDELDLLNKKYQIVCDDRPWEFLKKEYQTPINASFINLPTDFKFIPETDVLGEQKKVVYIDGKTYEVVSYSDRRNYTSDNYCWINLSSNKLEFNLVVTGNLSFDYICIPDDLTTATEPVFPIRFQHILYHLMASDDYMIQQFDKARSYAGENAAQAESILERMRIWNANLTY